MSGHQKNAEMAWDRLEKAMVLLREKDEALAAANARADAAEALAEDRRKARDVILGDVHELRESLTAARRECDAFRRLLWLRHGCSPSYLYGDDGEMQCGNATCLIDFKRMSAKEIEARWMTVALAALSRDQATEAADAAWRDGEAHGRDK